jgi:hypothetical protein
LAESLPAEAVTPDAVAAAGTCSAGATGSGTCFRNSLNAMVLLQVELNAPIFPSGREVRVNNCLIFRQAEVPAYPRVAQFFDFGRVRAYKAALSTLLS